jgi:hypothetical protein
MNQLAEANLQKLSEKKIFFGHQSVGDNILDGLAKLMQHNKAIRLNIVKTSHSDMFTKPMFAHASVGSNGDANSKIAAFRDYIRNGIGKQADMAFFKFCFWDIRSKTDIQQVFNNYKTTLSELEKQYPSVTFVHFTIPLMSRTGGIKGEIKKIFNMTDESDRDNMRRNELNNLILKEYGGREHVFDIAAFESTLPDGRRTFFSNDGQRYYYLAPEYTDDGGHLNDRGRKIVAEEFLIFLAKLANE